MKRVAARAAFVRAGWRRHHDRTMIRGASGRMAAVADDAVPRPALPTEGGQATDAMPGNASDFTT